MAIVRYGSIVTELKGKIGGQVFQGGNNALVLRNQSKVNNTKSTALQLATRNLSINAKSWRAQSAANQDAWATWAPNWVFYDKYGNAYTGSGYQVYCAYNTARLSMGLATVNTPDNSGTYINLGAMSLAYVVNVSLTLNWVTAGQDYIYLQVFGAPPCSKGVNANNKRWSLITSFVTTGLTSKNITAVVLAHYGVIIAGSRYYAKIVQRTATGPIIQNTQIISVDT